MGLCITLRLARAWANGPIRKPAVYASPTSVAAVDDLSMPIKSSHARFHVAALRQLASGARPTTQSLLEECGGSSTTVTAALASFWKEYLPKELRELENADVPLPLRKMASDVWDRAIKHASDHVEAANARRSHALDIRERELDGRAKTYEREWFKLEIRHSAITNQLVQAHQETSRLNRAFFELQDELAGERLERARIEERAAGAEQRLADAKVRETLAQDRYDAAMASHKRELDAMHAEIEALKARLERAEKRPDQSDDESAT